MDRATIEALTRVHATPAVSIMCRLDHRRPGNAEDRLRLAALRDQAVQRVAAERATVEVSALVARIDAAVASVDLQRPTPGVALFVTADELHVVPLDVAVDPRVVVNETFATRDLVAALGRSARARVLVLSRACTRCIDVTNGAATERTDHGFPIEVVPPTEADAPHGDFPLDEHEHDEAAKFVFRAVEHALDVIEQRDPRPIIVVGPERDLAYFDDVTGWRSRVIGRVHGNHVRDTVETIEALVRPVFDEHVRRSHAQACSEVREAIGTRAVHGIDAVWEAARAGRGHSLVVEADFRYPARVVDGDLVPAEADDPGALDDAVDETIGAVVRTGGDVTVVENGSLTDLRRIALLLRY